MWGRACCWQLKPQLFCLRPQQVALVGLSCSDGLDGVEHPCTIISLRWQQRYSVPAYQQSPKR